MLAKLKGTVDVIARNSVIIDVRDIGYEVFLPNRLLANLVAGQDISLFIYSHIREDQFSLYGFFDPADKIMLLELTKVSGIGVKSALAILGLLTSEQIKQAITFGDKASLIQVPGIGKKAAERIITELKDKLAKGLDDFAPQISHTINPKATNNQIIQDTLSALENLGYARIQIAKAVTEVCQDESISLEDAITQSLRKIA
jgi:holliday junction DNA helicase RuvA